MLTCTWVEASCRLGVAWWACRRGSGDTAYCHIPVHKGTGRTLVTKVLKPTEVCFYGPGLLLRLPDECVFRKKIMYAGDMSKIVEREPLKSQSSKNTTIKLIKTPRIQELWKLPKGFLKQNSWISLRTGSFGAFYPASCPWLTAPSWLLGGLENSALPAMESADFLEDPCARVSLFNLTWTLPSVKSHFL